MRDAAADVGSADGPTDVLLTNTRGEVTESSIANVLIDLTGQGDWVTPPVESGTGPATVQPLRSNPELSPPKGMTRARPSPPAIGLLPGLMRAQLLEAGTVREAVVTVAQLYDAYRVRVPVWRGVCAHGTRLPPHLTGRPTS